MTPDQKGVMIDFLSLVDKKENINNACYSRTIPHFFKGDVLPVAQYIRTVFVPNCQETYVDSLTATWNWLSYPENRRFIDQIDSSFESTGLLQLPTYVLMNQRTLFLLKGDGYFRSTESDNFVPFVAYASKSQAWKKDINAITKARIDNLRINKSGKKKRWDSTSRTLWIVGELLKEGDLTDLEKYEAVDHFTGLLLMDYFIELTRRGRTILENNFIPK